MEMTVNLHCSVVFGPYVYFFFNDTATTEIYTLSLHDALPIGVTPPASRYGSTPPHRRSRWSSAPRQLSGGQRRSEEHTSELQSHLNLVCRLLLEKKKKHEYSGTYTNKKKNKT